MRSMWLVFFALACVACAQEEGSPWTRVDSAGIEIYLNNPEASIPSPELEEVLRLGTVTEGGPTQFFRVRDLEFLSSGSFAVVNAGTEQVRLFSLDGEFQGQFGQPGNGPAEFDGLSFVQEFGDSLLTYDAGNDRVGIRDQAGTLARSFRLEWFNGALFPVALSNTGTMLTVTARRMTELEGMGRVVDTAVVSIYDLEGNRIDSLARLPHNERFVKQDGGLRTTVGMPFSENASLVSVESGFCHAFGPELEVTCYDETGNLQRILRIEEGPHPVREEDIDGFWDRILEESEGPRLDAMRRVRNDMVYPRYFPAISGLLVDDEGRIWAQQYAPDSRLGHAWWVFQNGGLVAEVDTPPGFEMLDVEGGLVGGVWRDELDVEHIQVYRLKGWEKLDSL